MDKHKLILISLFAGIIEAVLLFVFFSFGAVIGSHLRFYGYRNAVNNSHRRDSLFAVSKLYIAEIKSIKNGKMEILNINKRQYSIDVSKVRVFSFSGKKISEKSLKVGEFLVIRKVSKYFVIRLL